MGLGESVGVFGRYVRTAADALGDLLQIVNTINEPSVVAIVGHLMGFFPPRVTDVQASHRVTVNLLKAHAAAAEAVRGSTDALIGLPLSVLDFLPTEDTPLGWRARDFMHWSWVGVWLEALRSGKVRGLSVPDETIAGLGRNDDFVGIQYYSRFDVHPAALQAAGSAADSVPVPVGARPALPGAGADERRTQMGWLWHPAGLGTVIDEVAEATGFPVQITENGIATADDDERIEFVRLHLEQVHERSRAAGTCAATSTGRRSTTSNGTTATGPRSGWSRSTAGPWSAPRSPASRGTETSRERTDSA